MEARMADMRAKAREARGKQGRRDIQAALRSGGLRTPPNIWSLHDVDDEGNDVIRYVCALRIYRDEARPLNDLFVRWHRAPGRMNISPLQDLLPYAGTAHAAEVEAQSWLNYIRWWDGREPKPGHRNGSRDPRYSREED